MNFANQFHTPPFEPPFRNDAKAGAATLLQVRDFISRQWRLIALATAFGMILGALYIAISPTKYTTQADMIIDTKRVTWTQTEMATDNRMVEDASVESEIETTKSEKVATMVIRRLHLTEDPEFVGTGHGLARRILTIFHTTPSSDGPEPDVSNEELTRRALGVVKGNLRVLRLGRSYIEQIEYTSLNRDKAAAIAKLRDQRVTQTAERDQLVHVLRGAAERTGQQEDHDGELEYALTAVEVTGLAPQRR